MTCEEFEQFVKSVGSREWTAKEDREVQEHLIDCPSGKHSFDKSSSPIRELITLAAVIAQGLVERRDGRQFSELSEEERRAYAKEIAWILNQWTSPKTPPC